MTLCCLDHATESLPIRPPVRLAQAALKDACFQFVQRNAATVLTDPAFMGLAAEHPVLWGELAANMRS